MTIWILFAAPLTALVLGTVVFFVARHEPKHLDHGNGKPAARGQNG